MQNGDEASPSINLAGQALLVKMLKTLEPHGIFDKILYSYVFQNFPATGMQNGDEASQSRSSSFNENAHNSWTYQ